jgi:uncharacterized protein DUF1842
MSSKAAQATQAVQAESVGLFTVGYQIGGKKPGAVTFNLNLVVSTPTKTVHGAGKLTQAINPPLDEPTHLTGEFTYMTVMPNKTSILVTATGFGPIDPLQPLEATNVRLRMVLSKDWQTGIANFDYLSEGKWNTVDNAPVTVITVGIPQ